VFLTARRRGSGQRPDNSSAKADYRRHLGDRIAEKGAEIMCRRKPSHARNPLQALMHKDWMAEAERITLKLAKEQGK
jgi:hypothetical protein